MLIFALAACSINNPQADLSPPAPQADTTPTQTNIPLETASTLSHTPLPPTTTVEPTQVEPTMTVEPTHLPPEHDIAVRIQDGIGQFYNTLTGEQFIPRGNNYIRLANQQTSDGTILYHSTFNIGLYNPTEVEEALRQMQADGYNTVRVFLNPCCEENSLGDPAGGLSQEYVRNLADFLQKAKDHAIYVIITTDSIPGVGGYTEILDSTWSTDFGGYNAHYLTKGGIRAEIRQWSDLIQDLISEDAPMDAIFAYELRNELFFESNSPPLNYGTRMVSTANGKKYNMAVVEDRQRMMDEGLVFWIDSIRHEILKLDPTALVTVGFFPPDKPNPWDSGTRVIRTYPAIWESSLDFIDLHPYPGGYSLEKLAENFEMSGMLEKPIIMGEFGMARSSSTDEARTARILHDWQVDSCSYGFDGWLLWTWDSKEQTDFYNGLYGKGLINQVLMPLSRPDPCTAGVFDFIEHNLALGKPAIASRSLPDQPPSGAVDGTTSQWWGAGAFPPQWVQIDLEAPATIASIRLVITQYPAGKTIHQVWVGPTADQLYLLHTFEDFTIDAQVLTFKPENTIENVRFIRVITRKSPSWVGWQEIEVMAP
jgi:hypothetical protein